MRNGKTPDDGNYLRQLSQGGLYPHRLEDGRFAPGSVLVLRRILTAEKNRAVVIVQTGFSTNIARLLKSPPDGISSLSGKELVARKVRLISLMGGNFAHKRGGEYNITTDLESARVLFTECTVPIVVSGYEVGSSIRYPAESIQQDFNYVPHHPVAEAYRLYDRMPYDRPTWDLTSVLYAVRPDSFGISEPGKITILKRGQTAFTPRPHGTHRYLRVTEQQCQDALGVMTKLVAMQPQIK